MMNLELAFEIGALSSEFLEPLAEFFGVPAIADEIGAGDFAFENGGEADGVMGDVPVDPAALVEFFRPGGSGSIGSGIETEAEIWQGNFLRGDGVAVRLSPNEGQSFEFEMGGRFAGGGHGGRGVSLDQSRGNFNGSDEQVFGIGNWDDSEPGRLQGFAMEFPQNGWVMASRADQAELLPLVRDFYEEERLVYDEKRVPDALADLLGDPALGGVWAWWNGGGILGYLIATIGFSVEFGGRFVLLDELFISPAFRGRGGWRDGFAEVEKWAAEIGAGAIRLEVNHHNEKARSLYLKYGFGDDERGILTKRLG